MSEKTIDQAKLAEFMKNGWSWHSCGGSGDSGTDNVYILEDDSGAQYSAYLSDEGVDLTATANDLRVGKVALNDDGVLTGEKDIPSYHTTEGVVAIPAGSAYSIRNDEYDYTKLQSIVCEFNSSLSASTSAEKVAIGDKVYAVLSAEALSSVTKDAENKAVLFGITNDSGAPRVIRYFMYKEVY